MKSKAVVQYYQALPLHARMSMFSASFPASGFDVTLTGMPNFDVISRLFVFDVHYKYSSPLVVPISCIIAFGRLEFCTIAFPENSCGGPIS